MSRYAHLFTGEAPAAAPAAKPAYRLLLVDDEPHVLSALRRCFRQEHYEVVVCEDPLAALALLQQQEFQVVISDFKMPQMNGGELLKQARQLRPDSMRIMLTGHADVDAVVSAVKAGAVFKFILKPWNDEDLRVTVALALERYELQQRNRALEHDSALMTREIERLGRLGSASRSQLAIVLGKKGLLTPQQVQEVFRVQQQDKRSALQIVLERGWVSEAQIRQLLRSEFLLPEVSLEEIQIDPGIAALVPARFCRQHGLLPLRLDGKRLQVALADPLDSALLEELRFVTGFEIQPVLVAWAALQARLNSLQQDLAVQDLMATVGNDPFENIEIVIDDDGESALAELLQSSEEPPAIRLVNAILLEAIRLGASDIHIQPRAKHVVVRLRIDGVLLDKIHIPLSYHAAVVSRLKVMSELDISERRRPQDGRITVKTPRRIVDVRISTLPTLNGEKVVMRILDRNSAVLSLASLGLAATEQALLERAVARPQGIILTTGPTGSGKTTTLYSLLQHNASSEKSYVTIEDPVEYYLDSAGQVLIKERIGLGFPTVLRAILRQDPDVILLGEIRDPETAMVAFQAAMSGHQVLSTLHTNSALATLPRLIELGLKPQIVASALEIIIAQRLVRRLCPNCREPVGAEHPLFTRLGGCFARAPATNWRARGCEDCHFLGYRGRIGLYELFAPDLTLRDLIGRGASMQELREAAAGFRSLHDDAYDKVLQGQTTLDEVLRVLGPV